MDFWYSTTRRITSSTFSRTTIFSWFRSVITVSGGLFQELDELGVDDELFPVQPADADHGSSAIIARRWEWEGEPRNELSQPLVLSAVDPRLLQGLRF